MSVLSIKVPIRKKSGNLFNDPRIRYIHLNVYKEVPDIKLLLLHNNIDTI